MFHALLMIFLFIPSFYFYVLCRWTNQIRSMMSLMNLCLTPNPLVSTVFALFLLFLTSLLLLFWGLMFLHQHESSPNVVNSLYSFGVQIPDSMSKFQNQFYSQSMTFCAQYLQPLWFFQKYDSARSNGLHP